MKVEVAAPLESSLSVCLQVRDLGSIHTYVKPGILVSFCLLASSVLRRSRRSPKGQPPSLMPGASQLVFTVLKASHGARYPQLCTSIRCLLVFRSNLT
jgi:hypothetical protein